MNRVDGMEALDAVENGMIKLGQSRDIWQNDVVYAALAGVRLLLLDALKERPVKDTLVRCKGCSYWQHMDSAKSPTMNCAGLQETGHVRTCGVERTYQRHRALSPLSLDAARAAELGVSYGQYKARGVV